MRTYNCIQGEQEEIVLMRKELEQQVKRVDARPGLSHYGALPHMTQGSFGGNGDGGHGMFEKKTTTPVSASAGRRP